MRKFQAFSPYTQPYLHTRDDETIKESDRKLLLKLFAIWIALAIIVIAVMFYRHLHGWIVIQK